MCNTKGTNIYFVILDYCASLEKDGRWNWRAICTLWWRSQHWVRHGHGHGGRICLELSGKWSIDNIFSQKQVVGRVDETGRYCLWCEICLLWGMGTIFHFDNVQCQAPTVLQVFRFLWKWVSFIFNIISAMIFTSDRGGETYFAINSRDMCLLTKNICLSIFYHYNFDLI